jgi:2-polyprenyl-3-methyl-5-hydroxy-6-metoxy-1,4-benzoquinol methylase
MTVQSEVTSSDGIKSTSFEYGLAYQRLQAAKYRDREHNHWKHRIRLAHELVDQYALPRLGDRKPAEITVVDVGTSIGTFAIEFAKRGFQTFGLDFDAQALAIAAELAREEGVEPTFVQTDVADWPRSLPRIDVAVCFDIFEHLHDDEMGAFLTAIRRNLSERGCLVFHTYPTQYDYLLFGRGYARLPLNFAARLPPRWFERLLRAYAAVLDAGMLLLRGQDYRDSIKTWSHCNPTTRSRLADVIARAGYDLLCLESAQFYDFKASASRRFRRQPSANRNIFGVAVPRRPSAPPTK